MIDREKIGALNLEGLKDINDMGRYRLNNPDKPNVIFPDDFVPTVSYVYESQYNLKGVEKIYYFTDKVIQRVRAMNVTSFLGPDNEACRMVFKEDECRYLVFPTYGSYGLGSMVYCTRGGHLYAKVFAGDYVAGYIVCDEKDGYKLCLIPYSVFSMITCKSFPDPKTFPRLVGPGLKLIEKDFGQRSADRMTTPELVRISRRKDFGRMLCHDMIEDHITFVGILFDALRALVFIKTADVYSKEYVPDHTPTYRRKNGYKPLNYTLIDSTWDMNIDVNSPFPVRGHFKMQPYKKEGRWDRKMIYIESYMKTGYHRRARKIIEDVDE